MCNNSKSLTVIFRVILLTLCLNVMAYGDSAFKLTDNIKDKELRERYPNTVILDLKLKGLNVVILKQYVGSGIIRQILHFFTKAEDEDLIFVSTVVIPANGSEITISDHENKILVRCNEITMCTLDRSLFANNQIVLKSSK